MKNIFTVVFFFVFLSGTGQQIKKAYAFSKTNTAGNPPAETEYKTDDQLGYFAYLEISKTGELNVAAAWINNKMYEVNSTLVKEKLIVQRKAATNEEVKIKSSGNSR